MMTLLGLWLAMLNIGIGVAAPSIIPSDAILNTSGLPLVNTSGGIMTRAA